MSVLSEEAYRAGWMPDLEYELWTAVMEGPRRYGRLNVGPAEIAELRRMSEACKGWIAFGDFEQETWLPLQEWQARYDKGRRERRSSRA